MLLKFPVFMPSGRTHDRITLLCLPAFTALCWWGFKDARYALLAGSAFLFSGLMFGPDLDIHSQQYKRWGPLRWLWLPYQKLLRHRSLWSHGFLVGTLGRILYLGFWLMLGLGGGQLIYSWLTKTPLLNVGFQQLRPLSEELRADAISIWLGLETGAMSHSLSDWVVSFYKKRRKKSNRSVR
ncbi:MAG: metal-binding protein [Cyanobacteria bacterium P01_H01_bin.15]